MDRKCFRGLENKKVDGAELHTSAVRTRRTTDIKNGIKKKSSAECSEISICPAIILYMNHRQKIHSIPLFFECFFMWVLLITQLYSYFYLYLQLVFSSVLKSNQVLKSSLKKLTDNMSEKLPAVFFTFYMKSCVYVLKLNVIMCLYVRSVSKIYYKTGGFY